MGATEKQLAQATKVFKNICAMLDDNDMKYSRHDDDFIIKIGFTGYEYPIDLAFKVYPEREFISVESPLPFKFDSDRYVDLVVAATYINGIALDGTWIVDIESNLIIFRMTNSYCDSILGKECYRALLSLTVSACDLCADKFNKLNEGTMSIKEFRESILNN